MDTVVALIQERGYNAFSYHHISGALGIRNAAVHYHFPSKADLGLAVVKRYHRQFDDWVAAHRDKGTAPLALLRGYFLIPVRFVRDGGKVCPLGVLEAEYKTIPDPVRQAVRELDADIRRFLADVLEQGRRQGVFRFEVPVNFQADSFFVALECANPLGEESLSWNVTVSDLPGLGTIEVAGELLVDLRAADSSAGESVWLNSGTLADFAIANEEDLLPVREEINGAPAVTFSGLDAYQCLENAPASIIGAETRSIEVWAYNPGIAGEETHSIS